MNREVNDILNQRKKLFILAYTKIIGNARKACEDFNIPRSSFYDWKKAFDKEGEAGLLRKKPVSTLIP